MDKNFLILMHYGLGDLLLSLPTVKELKEYFPESKITMFISKLYWELSEFTPYVDSFLFFKSSSTVSRVMELLSMRKRYNFDTAIILNPLFQGTFIAYLLGAKKRIGYYRDFEKQQNLFYLKYFLLTKRLTPRDSDIYEVERYFDVIKYGLGLNGNLRMNYNYLSLTNEHKHRFNEIRKQFCIPENSFIVALCPQSSIKQKEWGFENYIEVFKKIYKEYKLCIIVLGTDKDKVFTEKLNFTFGTSAIDLRGQTTLRDLIILIYYSKLILSVDNGAMHIAALFNKPTIALFGPSNQKKFGHPNVVVINKNCECAPCTRKDMLKCRDLKCIRDITVEEVKSAILRKLTEITT